MPASGKQIEANRANATKSTGPRTAEGKERSKMNAVVHGLTAQAAVLRGEDPEHLDAMSDSLMKQLKPRGMVQRLMAERIVSLAWKLRRVARAEEVVGREMEEDSVKEWKYERQVNLAHDSYIFAPRPRPRPREGAALLASSWRRTPDYSKDERLLRLTEYELKLDAALRAATRDLLKLQKEAAAFEEDDEAANTDESFGAADRTGEGASEATHGDAKKNPGLRRAAPPACGEADVETEAPLDKTNPIPGAGESAQDEEPSGVTPDSRADSSAPVPGTFSSPPPRPRR